MTAIAKKINDSSLGFLKGGGEMGKLSREYNWAKTSMGSPEAWPQSLRTTLSIILNSRFPMFLWWGPQLICFYNDAYRPSLGNNGKHPHALGQPAAEVWPEIWHIIKPLIDQVLNKGEAYWSEDQLVPIYRNGKIEDVYWTFCYSPVHDESDAIAGVLVTCTETTQKIVNLKQVEESKNQLEFAIEATELGTWDLNPATNKFSGNHRIKEWFGLEPENQIDLSLAINVMAENDRQRVAEAIQRALQFSSGGHYDIEYTIIHPTTKKERILHAKGRASFNNDKIAYRFNGTLQDITERKKSEKALELKNSELLRINTDLDNFIYTASHDLKAPISNLEGLMHALAEGTKFDEEQRTIIRMILHSIERFKTTIRDLTEISKIQRIEEHNSEIISFDDILTEVQLDMRELIDSFKPLIKTHFNVPEISYSRKNLRSIIYNLLSNALKYSSKKRKPEVKITTEKENNFVVLTVADNGLGLSKDNQRKIFGMFKRAHQHIEGTGIGLYMIKRMIENSGGKIEVESTIEEGTTFKVYFKII